MVKNCLWLFPYLGNNHINTSFIMFLKRFLAVNPLFSFLCVMLLVGGVYFFYQQTTSQKPSEEKNSEVLLQLRQLESEILEKYPEMKAFSSMSPEDFKELLSIPEERERLQVIVEEMRTIYFAKAREIFSAMPPETIESEIEASRQHMSKIWGNELTDILIIRLREELGL